MNRYVFDTDGEIVGKLEDDGTFLYSGPRASIRVLGVLTYEGRTGAHMAHPFEHGPYTMIPGDKLIVNVRRSP